MLDNAPARLLAALAGALGEQGVPWYLFGAQAVIVYGRPRMTADVDVTVRLGEVSPGKLVSALAGAGFHLRVPDVESFVSRTRVLPFAHQPTGLPVDIVLAGPGLEEMFLERARPVDIGGVVVPVISPEDLVVTKILAGRLKDREDVLGIIAERGGSLDLARVRQILATVEAALDQSDLSPLLEELVASATRRGAGKRQPRKK